jgi:hypothetical protein
MSAQFLDVTIEHGGLETIHIVVDEWKIVV